MPRKPLGETAMTDAERQARYRAARAGGQPIIRFRRPADHRGRAKRWCATVDELVQLQAEYQAWLDALPQTLQETATAEALPGDLRSGPPGASGRRNRQKVSDATETDGRSGYAANASVGRSSVGLLDCQFHGSRVCISCALVRPETIRSSASVSQAIGSTPFNFAVWISVIASAQCFAPPSDPAKSAFFLVRVFGRIARSTTLVSISTRPSSRNSTSPGQCRIA